MFNRIRSNIKFIYFKIFLYLLIEAPLVLGFITHRFERQVLALVPEAIIDLYLLFVFITCSILFLPFRLLLPGLFVASDNGLIFPASHYTWFIPIAIYGLIIYFALVAYETRGLKPGDVHK